jgi:hypothetical protein
MGSRLLYFNFPPCYQHQALSGAPMFYMTPGPTTRRKQPPLAPDEKEVPCKKIIKFVAKGYIGPIEGKISLLIKYFAVPKGIINGVVQDWRTVFHAGTNKLSDCIWTPSFSLPTVNTLLCIVNHNTLMAD